MARKAAIPSSGKLLKTNEKNSSCLTEGLTKDLSPRSQKPESRSQNFSEAGASASSASGQSKGELFETGVQYLVATGATEQRARAFIGKLRNNHSDHEILEAMETSEAKGAVDPIPYIKASLEKTPREIVKPEIWDRLEQNGAIQ